MSIKKGYLISLMPMHTSVRTCQASRKHATPSNGGRTVALSARMRVDRPQPRRHQRVGSRGDLSLELLVERHDRRRDGHTSLEVLAVHPVGHRAAHGVHAAVGRVGGCHLHALVEEAEVLVGEADGRREVPRDVGEGVARVTADETYAARAATARRLAT
eukprot:scaffold63017_cov63-Phaeocystis_antarctica.AAC.1